MGEELQIRPKLPKLRKQNNVEHFTQITHACRPPRSELEPNHPLNRGDVVEAPAAEVVFNVDELLREVVQIPIRFGVAVHGKPCGLHSGFALGHCVERGAQLARGEQTAISQRF